MITRQIVATQLYLYLNHTISLTELVHWCEEAMMTGEVETTHEEVINEIIARIGLADVAGYGLLWQDCEKYLSSLGYQLHFDLLEVA